MKTKVTFLADHDSRLVYLNGSTEDIKNDWLLLFNHGATNEELEWIFEDRASFYTNEPQLLRGLQSVYFHRLLNNDETMSDETADVLAASMAQDFVSQMEKESNKPIYLAINRPYKDAHEYGMGTITTPSEKSFASGE
jgi:hypothetical protein